MVLRTDLIGTQLDYRSRLLTSNLSLLISITFASLNSKHELAALNIAACQIWTKGSRPNFWTHKKMLKSARQSKLMSIPSKKLCRTMSRYRRKRAKSHNERKFWLFLRKSTIHTSKLQGRLQLQISHKAFRLRLFSTQNWVKVPLETKSVLVTYFSWSKSKYSMSRCFFVSHAARNLLIDEINPPNLSNWY